MFTRTFTIFKVTRKNNGTYNQQPTPNGWGYAGTEFNGTGSNWDGGTALGTDTTKGYPCLDQPGRGQGDLITGLFPNKVNSTTGDNPLAESSAGTDLHLEQHWRDCIWMGWLASIPTKAGEEW